MLPLGWGEEVWEAEVAGAGDSDSAERRARRHFQEMARKSSGGSASLARSALS